MTPLTLTLVQCPTCQGFGVVKQNGTLTCTTCHGTGSWLQDERGVQLRYPFPELISPTTQSSIKQQKWLRYALFALSLGLTGLSALYILVAYGAHPGELLWHRDIAHAVFGLSGPFSMWALAGFKHEQASILTLHDLPEHLGAAAASARLDLQPYSNPRIKELFDQAALTAQELHSTQIDDAVFLITLLDQPRIRGMLARLELGVDQLSEQLAGFVQVRDAGGVQTVSLHPMVRTRVYAAMQEALSHDFPYLDSEDVLLAYLKEPGPYTDLFHAFNLTYDEVYAVSRWYAGEQERARQWAFWLEKGRTRPSGFMNQAWTALPTPFLDQHSSDITRMAGNGQLAMVTVRDKEMAQIMQVLGRTKKNNVLLVGDPGVGKNALIGAIAQRMIEEQVPEILKDKRLVSLDLGGLLSGADAVAVMQKVLGEVEQAGNVILAIPEVQHLVASKGGSLDAAGLLSQAMDRGSIQVITSATFTDFHRYVESNQTMTALLEVIEVKEVSPEQAVEILEEEAPQIEHRQNVFLTYPALDASVRLAKQYIPDKMLPDSAISLLDEAAAAVQQKGKRWVTKEDVESAIEGKTNIPIRQAAAQEADMLLNLEGKLHERIIGQEQAVAAVANALRRARAGLRDTKRPISSFLFVGPTGVGKTETAKAVADLFFGNSGSMIRLDMSEYQDARSVYKLIGAPAADSDSYTEGGALTQPIREHPYSLILLDEIEKAYPDVLNLFLQLLDDGRLTENTGRTVYYNNTLIVATSNAGSSDILKLLQQAPDQETLTKQMLQILQAQFRPEFLNRFDAIVPFYPLRKEEVAQVVTLMLQGVIDKAATQRYEISLTPEAVEKLGVLGYDPLYGARPLRRVVQEKVEGLLATLILKKELVPGQALRITAEMIE